MPRQKSTYVEDPIGLAERLRAAREEAGITQRTLAFPGCSAAYISRLEAGDRIPSLQLLRELGRRLGVTEEYLLTGSDAAASEPTRLANAEIALRLDEIVEAQRLYEEVLATPNGDAERIEALTGLGRIALRDGRVAEAIEQLELALDGGDPAELPVLAETLGCAYLQAGELAPAIALFERCVSRNAPEVDPLRYIRFSGLLGSALTDSGDHARAEQIVADAVERGKALTDPYTRARLYWSQSRLLAEQGEGDASARAARTALQTLNVTDDSYSLALAQQMLARVFLEAGRADDATAVLREARPLVEASATRTDLARFEIDEARALAAGGRSKEAASLAAVAAERLVEARPADAGRAYIPLADVHAQVGDRARASELLELAIELLEGQPQTTRYLVDAYRQLGLLLEADGRAEEALDVLKRALTIQARAGRAVT